MKPAVLIVITGIGFFILGIYVLAMMDKLSQWKWIHLTPGENFHLCSKLFDIGFIIMILGLLGMLFS